MNKGYVMKIENSNIYMASERHFISRDEERENLSVWIDPSNGSASGEKVSISAKAKCLAEECSSDELPGEHQMSELKMTLDALLAEILSGKKIKILDLSEFQRNSNDLDITEENSQSDPETESGREGWGVSYNYQESHYEKEEVSFSAAGIIKTGDNKEIEFSLQLSMQREYASYESFRFRAGDALLTDPLVINFNGNAAELSDIKFSFDLDSDGINEDVPVLKPGSGYLVIDSNGDGVVNNGKELFGPQTGNGFKELSAHDVDGNNWIDENDPVYSQLRVWTMDAMGDESLRNLKDIGIGAINTGNLSTRFDQKGNENELTGQTVRTGIYLRENGTAGTIQQVDLAV
jgi:hypothetical protein